MQIMCMMLGMADSLWDFPENPSCICCGRKIESDLNAREFFSQVPNFNPGGVRHITLSVDELRSMLAEGKCQWQSAYRAMVLPLNGRPFISGVSYRHSSFGARGGNVLAVPGRPDTATLVKGVIHPRGLFWFGKPDTNPRHVQASQVGWPMHESCWMILDKCIGGAAIENHVEVFMHAFNREHVRKRGDWFINRPVNEGSPGWMFLHLDPFNVPGLHELAQFMIRNPFPITDQLPRRDVTRPRGFTISQGSFSQLPLEIAMEIAKYLSVRDLHNLILAARWKFPNSFWKRRIPSCIFELHEALADRDVDWQYLGLEYERMMARRPNGIQHRRQIVRYVSRIYATCCGQPREVVNSHGFVTYFDLPLP